MLPTRAFLRTTRAMSVVLDTAALGSAWVPCRFNDAAISSDAAERAMAVFLNSSIGILSMLGDRSNRKPTYPNFSIGDLNGLRVPRALGQDCSVVRALSETFLRHREAELKPLPDMGSCSTRLALDTVVGEALNVDPDTVEAIRRELANEPSVTGQRYAA